MSILQEVRKCKITGRMYDGQTCQLNEGCPSLIKSGSSDELTIADWMEQELGFRNTIIMVIEN